MDTYEQAVQTVRFLAILNSKCCKVRVVPAPCWVAFSRQPADYRASVLLPAGARRVTLEAGVTTPWGDAAGERSLRPGIDRFGSSGPYKELARAYGLTPEQVADCIVAELPASS